MPNELARRLRDIVAAELPVLATLSDAHVSSKPAGSDSWSPKQELGHLIDSAANNHLRFVRGAISTEATPKPLLFDGYAQNAWVSIHGYDDSPWQETVAFWGQYNTFLAALIERIPASALATECTFAAGPVLTLGFVIDDYIVHMQHHLDHLIGRAVVTPYPQIKPQTT